MTSCNGFVGRDQREVPRHAGADLSGSVAWGRSRPHCCRPCSGEADVRGLRCAADSVEKLDSLEDEKLRAVLERQARFQLRGYEEELMSQRRASQWPTSVTECHFS